MENIFHSIREKIFVRSLNEKIKNRLQGKRRGLNFDKSRTIGILFDATNMENRNLVLEYAEQLRSQKKQVKLLGFFDSKMKDENFTFRHFNRSDIDWAFRPKGSNVEEFMNQQFDVLINLNTSSTTSTEYISALSKANFKVGPFTERTICYDLMIDTDQRTSLRKFIDQMEGLLEKTKAQ